MYMYSLPDLHVFSLFSGLGHMTLITFPKVLQLIGGVFGHLEQFVISFKTFEKKFRGMFRVFRILAYEVKRCFDVPQIDTE